MWTVLTYFCCTLSKQFFLHFKCFRPKTENAFSGVTPVLAPPPVQSQAAFTDTSPRFNPFDQQNDVSAAAPQEPAIPFG